MQQIIQCLASLVMFFLTICVTSCRAQPKDKSRQDLEIYVSSVNELDCSHLDSIFSKTKSTFTYFLVMVCHYSNGETFSSNLHFVGNLDDEYLLATKILSSIEKGDVEAAYSYHTQYESVRSHAREDAKWFWLVTGYLYSYDSDIYGAEAAFRSAINADSNFILAMSELSLMYYEQKRYDKYIESEERLYNKTNDVSYLFGKAVGLIHSYNLVDAFATYTRIYQLDTTNIEALSGLAWTTYLMRNNSLAESDFKRIVATHPGDEFALRELFLFYLIIDSSDKAIKLFPQLNTSANGSIKYEILYKYYISSSLSFTDWLENQSIKLAREEKEEIEYYLNFITSLKKYQWPW